MGDGLRLSSDRTPTAALENICAEGPVLFGIDVSYYQGDIDWNAVAADGIEYALIRVSHSLEFFDPQFEANWNGARAAGVAAGVYQYFEPDEDPIAQADLLLENMGPLMPGDLPPVIDVESTAGLGPQAIAEAVGVWVEHVEAELGVRPIIYTGPYFWQDNVGSDAFPDYPLWIAHYGTECPLTPTPWTDWTFHQFTDSGSTAGVSGNVDQNRFDGTIDDLLALGTGEVPVCGVIAEGGGTIDNGDDCHRALGNATYWREEADGIGGSLLWTNATDFDESSNSSQWELWLAEGGSYGLEVHIVSEYAQTTQATYRIQHAGGDAEVLIDQSQVDGWISLGEYDFDAEARYFVQLHDNTGESNDLELGIVVDALRVSSLEVGGETGGGTTGGDDDDDDVPPGDDDDDDADDDGIDGMPLGSDESGSDGSSSGAGPDATCEGDECSDGCGCRSTTPPAQTWLLALWPVFFRRRRHALAYSRR